MIPGTRNDGTVVRYHMITRRKIVVYNVQTMVDRQLLAERAADSAAPHDCCLRINASSSRTLLVFLKIPALAMPNFLPPTHTDEDRSKFTVLTSVLSAIVTLMTQLHRRGLRRCNGQMPVLHVILWTKLGSRRAAFGIKDQ